MGGGVDVGPVRYVRVGDVDLAYQVYGDGPVDVLVVPPSVWNIDVIRDLPGDSPMERMAALGARVITYDRRGTGLSDRPVEPLSMDGLLDDITAVLEAVGSTRTAFFALSEAGPMSLLYAAANPDRVSHLVLWGSFARFIDPGDGTGVVSRDRLEAVLTHARQWWGTGMLTQVMAPSWADHPHGASLFARLERSAHTPRSFEAELALASQIDLSHAATSVRCPTLVLHATGDQFVPVTAGRHLASLVEGARLVEVDGVDHIIAPDVMDEVMTASWEFITGQRPLADVQRMLSTVVLTDIVDSTARAADLGDRRWRALLDQHDELVATEVDRHGGRVVKLTGDGMLAIFDRPGRAVRCAVTLREAARSLDLEIRAGVHTGEIERRGDDVGGLGVHIAARVEALAAPGEVLVSRTVTDLVAGSGLTFTDRGTHDLKGVPGSWQVYAVLTDSRREGPRAIR